MNDRELEAALRRLGRMAEPPVSMTSDVMKRVEGASAPNGDPTLRPRYRIHRAAAFFVAAAACVGAVLLAPHAGQLPAPRPPLGVLPTTNPEVPIDSGTTPSLVNYRRVYSQSPEAFEALLQQRPSEALAPLGREYRAADSLRSDFNLYQ